MRSVKSSENPEIIQHSTIKAWMIWAASASFVLFQFFLQLSGGVIVEDLMHSFAINALGAGILSSTYYYVYVALQTPAGILVDRYGPRRLLAGGGLICALGCWLFAVAGHLMLAEVGRLFMGAGSSFAFVGSLFLIAKWFPPEKFALMVGIAETIGTIGSLLGNIFLASLLNSYGWRLCMIGASMLAILIAIICWVIIRDRPISHSSRQIHESPSHFLHHALALLKNPKAWLNGIYSGLVFSVVTVFVALWGIPFLVKAHNISITAATITSSFLFLGLAVGCPVLGLLSNRIKHRNRILSYSALLAAIVLVQILLATTMSIVMIDCLMFILGLFCSSYVINFAIAKEIAPADATSTSMGFTNTLSVVTAPLLQPIVGAILHLAHQLRGLPKGLVESYSIIDYQIALMILPLCLILAAIMALYID